MRFQILGPLRVGGGEATVSAGRDRTVLAVLLLRANRVVAVEELVDAVWEERPPATARAQLQTCVSRLRQRLARLGLPPETIVTDPVGYAARIGPQDLDAEVFARAVDAARTAVDNGRTAEARRHYRTGLALWRGPALAGVTVRSVRGRAQALDEQRLAVLEECVDVELRLGLAAHLVDELTEAVQRHPLRDRLRGQLMLALSAVGRQADALTAYRDGRRLYAEELGIEPGAALQELHQRVLAGDLAVVDPGRAATAPARGLPRAISDFTGRQETIARLVKEIEENRARIQLVDGMAGSGKTTLAVHLATRLADRYPDAQLFIDLHGHSDRAPLTPATASAALLRQLGVPQERIPPDPDDRLALWRTELAGRRALLLLDNAADADQVAPLLPTGRGCLTLITSRRRLVGLDEGRPSSLPVLEPEEAVELLGRVAGEVRVAAEPEAAAEVAHRCGYLPLAIRLAGARLAHRPRWRITDLVERLREASDPLAELAAGQRSVGDAFALSYAQVSVAAQRLLRLLGLHPGGRFDNTVAAALADLPMPEAQDVLDELVDAHLVDEPAPGRYCLHDLVREYARTLLAEPAHAVQRRAAVQRLLDHHLHVAAAIARTVESPGNRRNFVLPDPPRPDLVAVCTPQGLGWLDENRATLTALARLAEDDFPRHCWQLARACWRPYFNGGQLDELIEMHTVGLRAAEALGDEPAVALMLNYLASGYFRLARFPHAVRLMERAAELSRRQGPDGPLANILWNLGSACVAEGNHQRAIDYFNEAARLLQSIDRSAEVTALLNNVAYAYLHWGRHEQALRICRKHLMLSREMADHRELANALGHTGAARRRMGDLVPARRLLRAALRRHHALGNRFNEGEVLNELGVIERESGRPEEAAALHREALIAITEAGDRVGQCASRNLLARSLLELGDMPSALDLFRRVLRDTTKINHRYEQARALDGIARCLRPTEPVAARSHWTRALALFEQLDVPDRLEVRRLLVELG
ncbi:DNA-binding transcriptional activator of the SARP family [Micromonospora nigra]|uniref:DNA-binding transcriptional activator of the SARP family n=1 Tax=Micromonospora nigra TaxID=145857 RepID=A0A1C6RUT6_9ACTN|nr:BTAD domain-containing putative transcriptional regulator [Micromonospora nigra]SCL20842.1 DNA-binding transcriptional activator of the SARP family [Micromonospora nigra]